MAFIVFLTSKGDMDLGLCAQDFPVSSASRPSKERAGGKMKHLDAGRASLLCSHTLTFPPGAIIYNTLSLHDHKDEEFDDYCYPCSRCSLFLIRERKKDTHAEKFRCAVRVRSPALCLAQFPVSEG